MATETFPFNKMNSLEVEVFNRSRSLFRTEWLDQVVTIQYSNRCAFFEDVLSGCFLRRRVNCGGEMSRRLLEGAVHSFS